MLAYLGTILPWPIVKCPNDWHFCDGSLLQINTYQALYSLIGTTYGGDGRSTFGIPDLRGRMMPGAAMGGSSPIANYTMGQQGGAVQAVVTSANMPAHTHTAPTVNNASGTYKVSSTPGTSQTVAGKLGAGPTNFFPYVAGTPAVPLRGAEGNYTIPVGTAGATSVVNTLPPYLGMNYIICLNGIYPQRQ